MPETSAIILAAGKSKRMRSALPKVLHPVCGREMLGWIVDACGQAGVGRMLVVVGHGKEHVQRAFAGDCRVEWVEQEEQKGTGHAALVCEPKLEGFEGRTIVIAGDMPLIRGETIRSLLEENDATGHAVTLATSIFDDPTGYGRIDRDAEGRLCGIVEQADCTDDQRKIREVNISYYCFDNRRLFEALHRITPSNRQGEYYITDAVRVLIEGGHGAGAIPNVPQQDALGVNAREDLALVNRAMEDRIQRGWMDRGVTLIDPVSTWIEWNCEIGCDTVVHPFSYISAGGRIGSGCRVGPYAHVGPDDSIPSDSAVGPMWAAGAMRS